MVACQPIGELSVKLSEILGTSVSPLKVSQVSVMFLKDPLAFNEFALSVSLLNFQLIVLLAGTIMFCNQILVFSIFTRTCCSELPTSKETLWSGILTRKTQCTMEL
jgi:hypothetical protein